jgi:hypothetical protein
LEDSDLPSHAADNNSSDSPTIMNSTRRQTSSFSHIDECRIRRSLDEVLKLTEIDDTDTYGDSHTVSNMLGHQTDDVSMMPSPIALRNDAHRHHDGPHSVKWNLYDYLFLYLPSEIDFIS